MIEISIETFLDSRPIILVNPVITDSSEVVRRYALSEWRQLNVDWVACEGRFEPCFRNEARVYVDDHWRW